MSRIYKISVVVPLYNEEDNIVELHQQIVAVTKTLPQYEWELVFIDDGSKDKTVERAQALQDVTLIRLRKNYGQTAAFDAGFKYASGQVIVTLDGDLQNDPADIPKLLEKINEGYDVVSGWRKNRKDTIGKRITSRTANLLRKLFFKDSIHDSGCALKAYRKECFENLDLYGEMHRFIPALLGQQGFTVTEVVVNHRARLNGVSKYGNLKRGIKSLTDMIAVSFWGRYSARPLHIFGTAGIGLILIGIAMLSGLFILRLFYGFELSERIWPMIAFFAILSGIQLFMIGILTDMQMRIYYRSHNRMNYTIGNITKL